MNTNGNNTENTGHPDNTMQNSQNTADEELLNRLAPYAGRIIPMLEHVFRDDLRMVLFYASGLAGIAAHEAVKANKGTFSVVETDRGKKYYFGEDVNRYLWGNKYSLFSFISAVSPMTEDNLTGLLGRFAANVGKPDFKIWDAFEIGNAYVQVKTCWDGIFENMIAPACKNAGEWPILFSIVVQNVINKGAAQAPKNQLANMAVDCANVLSKMDRESL